MSALFATTTTAAFISWGAPQEMTGDTDISTAGGSVFAINATGTGEGIGDGTASITANGVEFVGYDIDTLNAAGLGITVGFGSGRNVGSPVFTSGELTGEIVGLVDSGFYGGVVLPPYVVTLSGLVEGHEYEIQLLVNDAREPRDSDWNVGLSDGISEGTDVILVDLSNRDPISGEGAASGDYIIGTFDADSSGTQTFNMAGYRDGAPNDSRAQINAIQLRDLSAPSGGDSWAGYPITNEAMDVDTGDFLDWINVFHGDYVWSYALSGWMYCPEANVGDSGAWAYVYK